MQQELTTRQREILDLIKQIIKKNGIPPTLKELGEVLGMAAPSVQQHVQAIEKKGFLKRESFKSRSLTIVGPEESEEKECCIVVPVMGTIAAGEPILAFEEKSSNLCMKGSLVKKKRDLFALKVKGSSMKDASILDGDYIVVQKQSTAENGDIVVALIDDEATVKKFYLKNKKIYLQPANEEYKPIVVSSGNFRIQGKVVAVYRNLN